MPYWFTLTLSSLVLKVKVIEKVHGHGMKNVPFSLLTTIFTKLVDATSSEDFLVIQMLMSTVIYLYCSCEERDNLSLVSKHSSVLLPYLLLKFGDIEIVLLKIYLLTFIFSVSADVEFVPLLYRVRAR